MIITGMTHDHDTRVVRLQMSRYDDSHSDSESEHPLEHRTRLLAVRTKVEFDGNEMCCFRISSTNCHEQTSVVPSPSYRTRLIHRGAPIATV